MAKPKAEPSPMRSGFCNPANPLSSHMRCHLEGCPCMDKFPDDAPGSLLGFIACPCRTRNIGADLTRVVPVGEP